MNTPQKIPRPFSAKSFDDLFYRIVNLPRYFRWPLAFLLMFIICASGVALLTLPFALCGAYPWNDYLSGVFGCGIGAALSNATALSIEP